MIVSNSGSLEFIMAGIDDSDESDLDDGCFEIGYDEDGNEIAFDVGGDVGAPSE